jgi:predicted ATP-binding protein involved in virulence
MLVLSRKVDLSMINCCLKSLCARNFASFADDVFFTTVSAQNKKESTENIFSIGADNYNRVSILYGANGSGKTFFCKILREIQRVLELSTLLGENKRFVPAPIVKSMDRIIPTFAFDSEYKDNPTYLALDIVLDGIAYHYSFEIKGKKIVSECLTKKHRRTEKLIERTSPTHNSISLRSELKSFEGTKNVVREESLCLPMAAMLNNPLAIKLLDAICSITVLNMTAPHSAPHPDIEAFTEERLDKYAKILRSADPTLRQLNVEVTENEDKDTGADDFESREKIKMVSVHSDHALFHKKEEIGQTSIDFFCDESLGTVKLFTSMPYLFDVLENGGVIVLDELENGLHLSLAREILNLFNNPITNPNNAQIICTSHQPLLVDRGFRRDQIWIASKDKYGKCQLHRMSNLKTTRAKVNLSNRLLEGAFGCNPDSFFGLDS